MFNIFPYVKVREYKNIANINICTYFKMFGYLHLVMHMKLLAKNLGQREEIIIYIFEVIMNVL